MQNLCYTWAKEALVPSELVLYANCATAQPHHLKQPHLKLADVKVIIKKIYYFPEVWTSIRTTRLNWSKWQNSPPIIYIKVDLITIIYCVSNWQVLLPTLNYLLKAFSFLIGWSTCLTSIEALKLEVGIDQVNIFLGNGNWDWKVIDIIGPNDWRQPNLWSTLQ